MIQSKISTLQYCSHQNSTPCLSERVENYPYMRYPTMLKVLRLKSNYKLLGFINKKIYSNIFCVVLENYPLQVAKNHPNLRNYKGAKEN